MKMTLPFFAVTDVHTQFTTFTCDEWFLSTDIITEFNVNNLILIISCSNSNASRINLIVTKVGKNIAVFSFHNVFATPLEK